jgi:hypothetical protein
VRDAIHVMRIGLFFDTCCVHASQMDNNKLNGTLPTQLGRLSSITKL